MSDIDDVCTIRCSCGALVVVSTRRGRGRPVRHCTECVTKPTQVKHRPQRIREVFFIDWTEVST